VPQGQFQSALSIPVLLYHGEGNNTDTQVELFRDQMQTLKNAGWHTITLSQFESFMKGGTVPDKTFLLTFDDGRTDTYKAADPILHDLGFSGVMFVITGFSLPDNNALPNPFYLSRTELQTMAESGRWELQSHSKEAHRLYTIVTTDVNALPTVATRSGPTATSSPGHFLSNKFVIPDFATGQNRFETDQEFALRVKRDLTIAKQTLETNFKVPVTAFAYPLNDFGQDTINFPGSQAIVSGIVSSLYQFAFYQAFPSEGETFNYSNPEDYMVRRIEPDPMWTGATLLNHIEAGRIKNLPYQSTTFGGEWLSSWGSVFTGSQLSLNATPTETGAASSLQGSHLWKNYTFTVNVSTQKGNEVSLISRRYDGKNFITCDFTTGKLFLEKHVHGNPITVATSPTSSASNTSKKLSMTVDGNTITCNDNSGDPNGTLTATVSDPILQSGGVGLQVWDQALNTAHADISKVDVEPIQ